MPDFRPFRLGDAISEGQGIAMNQYRLGETVRNEQARAGLEQAIRTGDDKQFKQQFPIEAQKYGDVRAERKAKQLEQEKVRLEDMHSLLTSVKDQSSLDMALQAAQTRGYDVTQTPKVFGPDFMQYQQMAVADVLGVKGKIEMDLKESEKIRAERKLGIDEKRADAADRTAAAAEKRADAAMKLAEGGGKPPAGYQWTPQGQLAPIPGGPADPVSKNQKMTDTERTASGYALRMEAAEKIMNTVPKGEQKPGVGESMAATLPLIGKVLSNTARSDERQKYRQAQEDWVRSKLRKESGAVIAEEEMDREIRVYFPQLGDSEAVIQQKAEARRVAMDAMKQASGPAYQPATPSSTGGIKFLGFE